MRSVLMFFVASGNALAHPGHGPEAGWLHVLTEPDHLALLLAPAMIGGLAWYFLRRRGGRR